MDGLDDHDGIIHHNTNGKDEGKEGQHIDGEAHRIHKEECPDERDGHCYGGYQRRTEILQEDIDYDEYQEKGFQQRPQHG